MYGRMVELTMVNGGMGKCMEKAFISGRMAENSKANIIMIKSMD